MGVRTPLTDDEIRAHLAGRIGWTGDARGIGKVFSVEYDSAIPLVGEVGRAAIELEHRPDIDIRWATLRFWLTTHTSADATTELDFMLADRIDVIAAQHGAVPADVT